MNRFVTHLSDDQLKAFAFNALAEHQAFLVASKRYGGMRLTGFALVASLKAAESLECVKTFEACIASCDYVSLLATA